MVQGRRLTVGGLRSWVRSVDGGVGGVSGRCAAIEALFIRLVEGKSLAPATCQVGVGQEGPTDDDGVGAVTGEDRFDDLQAGRFRTGGVEQERSVEPAP